MTVFGEFEGDMVAGASVWFQGTVPVRCILREGDVVVLLLQAEVCAVTFSRNQDGDVVRRHTLRVMEVTEPPEHLVDGVVAAIGASVDDREGRVRLPM